MRTLATLQEPDAGTIRFRAMYTLREHIGAQQVNLALRRYLQKYGGGGVPPSPSEPKTKPQRPRLLSPT